MRLSIPASILVTAWILSGCANQNTNPADPYESFNRKVFQFNRTLDAVLLKPPARLYKTVVPLLVRTSINNFYNNIYLVPTIANDILQAEGKDVIRDSWRLLVNSTLGVGGLFDVAVHFSLPLHRNDLGITFAKWGVKESSFLMIPLLGPATIRDGIGMGIEWATFTPFFYLHDHTLMYSLIGLRYIDIRSQYLETEKLMDEALDKYAFIRDAYLQNRQYAITGNKPQEATDILNDEDFNDYID